MSNDPLGLDLTDVSTANPVLLANTYVFRVKDIKSAPMKNDKPGTSISIELSLEGTAKTITGADVNPGFVVFDRNTVFNADVTDEGQKKSREINLRKLAQFQEAVVGTKGAWSPENYIGKLVTAKLKVRSDDTYGDSNEVSNYVKKSA